MTVSAAQLDALISYLEDNHKVACAVYARTTEGRSEASKKWSECAKILNRLSDGGIQKDANGWRVFYNEFKSRLVKKIKLLERAKEEGNKSRVYLSPLQQRLANILVQEGDLAEIPKNYIPKPLLSAERKEIVFFAVKDACIDLVKKHGHPVSLIDEEAFRTILHLLPMTKWEKNKITSKYIKNCLDSMGDYDEMAMSNQDDQEASDNDDEETDQTIKGEVEEVQCNCDARVSEDSTAGHDLGCPAAAKQPYWNYFEVTIGEATCQICCTKIKWQDITTLKEHLVEKHPNAEFVEDGEELLRGWSQDSQDHDAEEVEEVYLEDQYLEEPRPHSPSRKRRRSSERPKSRSEKTEAKTLAFNEKTNDNPFSTRETTDKVYRTKESKEETPQVSKERRDEVTKDMSQPEMSKNVIETTSAFYKSLDIFGQYVVALMKLIPKDKCLKFQVQIVQRLLQEQAAAG